MSSLSARNNVTFHFFWNARGFHETPLISSVVYITRIFEYSANRNLLRGRNHMSTYQLSASFIDHLTLFELWIQMNYRLGNLNGKTEICSLQTPYPTLMAQSVQASAPSLRKCKRCNVVCFGCSDWLFWMSAGLL